MRVSSPSCFWNIFRGPVVGYVESVGRVGFIFKHTSMRVRITSSNVAKGELILVSLSKYGNETELLKKATQAVETRTPVLIQAETDYIGSPHVGYIFGESNPNYAVTLELQSGLVDTSILTR